MRWPRADLIELSDYDFEWLRGVTMPQVLSLDMQLAQRTAPWELQHAHAQLLEYGYRFAAEHQDSVSLLSLVRL